MDSINKVNKGTQKFSYFLITFYCMEFFLFIKKYLFIYLFFNIIIFFLFG